MSASAGTTAAGPVLHGAASREADRAGAREAILVPAPRLHRQLEALFTAWCGPAHATASADALVEADLMGIDSHGITLVTLYEELVAKSMIARDADIRVVQDLGAIAVLDAGGGFGHAPATRAMDLACERAAAFGVGAVAVRGSNHFGAAGVYALRAARAGMIGLVTSAVHAASIVPVFGRAPRLGTNPIAFAAPGADGAPFLLDIATSTIAIGKLKLAAREGRRLPDGWALDADGRPQHDPEAALRDRLMTPLGGSREMGGHKGYGLAAMVEVLSTLLAGASYAPLRDRGAPRYDVGHLCLALSPEAFRGPNAFGPDLDAFLACLRETPPAADAARVLAPGDPEHAMRARREREGIPIPRSLVAAVKAVAEARGAGFHLEDPDT
ncbi:Ldh family oxidoreductase [Salinarimonas ramus]|uniref:Malate dehydrogenase n=1 Tax=Salinarimonas ramus TaxID=690164 RepID=A0A917V2Y9_9HYPH|nr:Ldh family oxidoreductase [Salinarimonas ramus]GGK27809.1 malate dehydrogenase [Salinarimonas ramus]